MSNLRSALAASVLCLLSCAAASGQAQKPEAYLRAESRQADGSVNPREDSYYYVEVYMPAPLRQAEYDLLSDAATAGGVKLGVLVDADEVELPNKLVVSPDDCVTSAGVKTCARTHFRINLPKGFDISKSYELFFDSYPVDTPEGAPPKVLRYRAVGVGKDYATTLSRTDLERKDRLTLQVTFAGVLTLDGVTGNYKPNDSLRFKTPQDMNAYSAYVQHRVRRLSGWLEGLSGPEKAAIEVRVRPLDKIIKPDPTENVTEPSPGVFIKADGTPWQPGLQHLPKLTVTETAAAPNAALLATKASYEIVTGYLKTDKRLPSVGFNVRVEFDDPSDKTKRNPSAPLEVPYPLVKSGMPGAPFVVADPSADATGDVGKRLIERDLDLIASYTGSLVEREEENPDPAACDPITVRKWENTFTLDGRVAPLGIRSILSSVNVSGDETTPPAERRTSAHHWLVTPTYIDFKVSSGKITKDTLSLNRVVIGTQLEYQYFYNNKLNPNFYRFIFRGSNASDRDFKQNEYKGTFEFRPVLSALSRPMKSEQTAQSQVIFDAGNKDNAMTYVAGTRGYEILPFVGAELGRTWSRRNPAEAVKPSDTVKRLYFGLDITVNPFERVTFKLSDTFYFRYESEDDRQENYFNTSIDYLLGKFAGNRAAHSIYVSYERGQLPPFNDPGVSAVKLGYRLRADRIFSPGVR